MSRNSLLQTVAISEVLKKEFYQSQVQGITLTNNEIKDITKVIKSLKNKGILLKGTTRVITSQEERFLNFLRPLNDSWFTIMHSHN